MINHTIGGSIKLSLVFEGSNPQFFLLQGLKGTSAILHTKSETKKSHLTFLSFFQFISQMYSQLLSATLSYELIYYGQKKEITTFCRTYLLLFCSRCLRTNYKQTTQHSNKICCRANDRFRLKTQFPISKGLSLDYYKSLRENTSDTVKIAP